jgi:hypothetical protein
MDVETTTQNPGADVTTALDNVASNSTEHVSGKALYVSTPLGVDEDKDSEKVEDIG